MFKRFWIVTVFVLLAALLTSTVALAQAGNPPAPKDRDGARRGVGQIVTVDADSFTIETRPGIERIFRVDENTRFRTHDGQVIELADLQTGDWVAGIAAPGNPGELLARLVVRLPDDFDPSQRLGVRAAGTISAIDAQAGTFTVHTRKGEDLTFATNENTIFEGGVEDFAGLQEGMQAAVGAYKQEDGSLLAIAVLARQPLERHLGKIVSVDTAGNSFTLQTRKGETLILAVDEHTRFHSKDGDVKSLEDLQPGMFALVTAVPQEDGSLLARQVLAD